MAASRAATPETALLVLAEALKDVPGSKSLVFFGWGLGRFSSTGVHMERDYGPARRALDRVPDLRVHAGRRRQDLATECSCPDWSNPCKHIAAVYYLLGEEFDRDPFLILKLRGMTREDLLGLLGTAGIPRPGRADPRLEEEAATPAPPQPLRAHPSEFWECGALPADPFGEVQIPAEPAALLERLGPFPFRRGNATLAAALEPAYVQASGRRRVARPWRSGRVTAVPAAAPGSAPRLRTVTGSRGSGWS